ncbi:hypothetical protein RHSIM_Rhsim01G0251300 [Rhododendron simsii]|uniref:Cytochrome P450 n=1 Tax=Rhododendron simsii TaxID=118357 RepID=A0A834HIG8_RHOSS|nr:hypothetical protein RHSIM_Rhsim01G0251300 [Rhododendron simsii]
MRKLAVIELLSAHRLEQFKHVRVSEIDTSIKELYRMGKTNQPDEAVEITSWVEQLTLNIITRMVSGKRYFDRSSAVQDPGAGNFRRAIKEFMYVSGNFFSSDVIPYPPLTWVDWGGKLRKVKRVMRDLDDIVQSWIDEHVVERRERGEREEGDEEDFIDVMLSKIEEGGNYGHTRETMIKATVLNLILAGADTGSINLTWILSILLNNRPALARAQEEIDTQIGKTRWVEECDVKNLVYLQAILKEALRLYPPGPLSVPHLATADCEIGGYHIPKGTRLLPNVWKLHRDPRVWPDPEKFAPERWLAGNHAAGLDVSGKNFEYGPFGAGRRSCPGLTLAMQMAQLALARLVQGFEFATPGDEAVDMSEGLGITLPKNLILAGADTGSINLTWILSILLNNRPALARAQEEIDAQIGKTRWVEECDVKNLVYLQAILHRDPRVWPDPEKFAPERWLAGNHAAGLDVSGKNFEYGPFGAGRRSCPGLTLAMQMAQLALARLVQGFEFATPGDEAVDMSEGMGITLPKAKPIEVLITPRLASDLYEG